MLLRPLILRLPLAIAAAFTITGSGIQRPVGAAALDDRPLTLPNLKRDERCPVTAGSLESVPPAPHIFGSGAVWFGRGPVFVTLAFKANRLPPAQFSLSRVPFEGGARRAKTPWVSEPAFAGPIVIRGGSLRPDRAALSFGYDREPTPRLELMAPGSRPSAHDWSFWGTSMYVPGPGCYGVQIDTRDKTDIVIFEATP